MEPTILTGVSNEMRVAREEISYRTISFNTAFGGYKQSGIGRENGLESIREYTQVKSIWIELSGETRDPFKLG